MMGVYSEGKDMDVAMSGSRLQPSRSSSRLSSVPRKIWKSRAKSQTRMPQQATWIPEGDFRWRSSIGQHISLARGVHLLELSEIERIAYQRVALQRLKAVNINCDIPKENNAVEKPKRRAVLIRRKAATTSIFEGKDGKYKEDVEKNLVFGIPLSKCIQNDKLLRHRSSSLQSEDGLKIGGDLQERNQEVSHMGSMDLITALGGDGDKPKFRSLLNTGTQVPTVLKACIQHLEKYGLCTLGLFRVSSSKKRVRQLREGFDRGEEFELDSAYHPHDVAQLLKEYFRDLPEPLFTRDLYGPLLNTLRLRQMSSDAQRWLISLLPVHNRDTLWALVTFLFKVAEHSEDKISALGEIISGNKMDAHNLATLIGPNVLRYSNSGKGFLVENNARAEERSDVILVARNIIEQHKKLFEVRIEDLDAVYRRLQIEDPEGLDAIIKWRFHNQLECEVELSRSSETRQSVPHILITQGSQVQPLTLAGNFPSRSSPDQPKLKQEKSENEKPVPPQRKERPARFSAKPTKTELSKSASASSLLRPTLDLLLPESALQINSTKTYIGLNKPQTTKVTPQSTHSPLQPGILVVSSERRQSRLSICSGGGVRFQNERWKRNEIISSQFKEK